MHAALNTAQEKRKLENHARLLLRRKEREEMRRINEKYRPKAIVTVSAPREPKSTPEVPLKKLESQSLDYTAEELFRTPFDLFEMTCGGEIAWVVRETRIDVVATSGEVLHSMEIPHITAIAQSGAHIWLGARDGTVHVFGKLSYSRMLTYQAHKDSVTCFASGYDEAFYSGSLDGTVVEWCDAVDDVHHVICQVALAQSVVCLACYGFRLFAAVAGGELHEYEAETGELVQQFDTDGVAIRDLLCVNGFLCTLQENGGFKVWNMNEGTCLRELRNSANRDFRAAFGDNGNKHLWLASGDGNISVFDLSQVGEFRCVQEIDCAAGETITPMKGIQCTHRFKVLVSYSNGKNVGYLRKTSVAEQDIRSALEGINVEWKSVAAEVNDIEESEAKALSKRDHLRLAMSTILEKKVACAQRKRIYFSWTAILASSKRIRELEKFSVIFSRSVHRDLGMRSFQRMILRMDVAKRTAKLKEGSEILVLFIDGDRRAAIWNKLKEFGTKRTVMMDENS